MIHTCRTTQKAPPRHFWSQFFKVLLMRCHFTSCATCTSRITGKVPLSTLSNVLHFFQSNVSHSPYVLIAQFDDSYLLNLVDTIVTLAGEYALQRERASLSAKPVLLASPFARGARGGGGGGGHPPPPPPSLARDFSRYSACSQVILTSKCFLNWNY